MPVLFIIIILFDSSRYHSLQCSLAVVIAFLKGRGWEVGERWEEGER